MLLKKYNRNFFLFLLSYSSRGDNFEWWTSLLKWKSFLSLIKMRDKYYKKRCFIIGNGPSLNNMDLTKLKNEVFEEHLIFPSTKYQKIEELLLNERNNGLTHIVAYKSQNQKNQRSEFVVEIYENENQYQFLKKIYDSKENGFGYHMKIFEINYESFDEYRETNN